MMPMPPAISSTGSSPAGASCSGKSRCAGPRRASACRPRPARACGASRPGCLPPGARPGGIRRARRNSRRPASAAPANSCRGSRRPGTEIFRCAPGPKAGSAPPSSRARRKERISGDSCRTSRTMSFRVCTALASLRDSSGVSGRQLVGQLAFHGAAFRWPGPFRAARAGWRPRRGGRPVSAAASSWRYLPPPRTWVSL